MNNTSTQVMVRIADSLDYKKLEPIKEKILSQFPITFLSLKTFEEFFQLISDPTFICDYLSIDIEQLYRVANVDVFALLNTVATLLTCSLERKIDGSLGRRNTKLVILVGSKTPPELIKEVISLPMITFVGLRSNRSGDGYSDDEVIESLRAILADDSTLPQQVQEMLSKRRKLSKQQNAINLTPRQRQIFNLVANRGASNKVIAKMLNISESTVKLHMGALLKKYKVRNRTQLAVFAKDQEQQQSTDAAMTAKLFSTYTP